MKLYSTNLTDIQWQVIENHKRTRKEEETSSPWDNGRT